MSKICERESYILPSQPNRDEELRYEKGGIIVGRVSRIGMNDSDTEAS